MCIAPITLPDGVQAGCHKCWQCRERRVDDWVGRCIAESKTALRTYSITLTYGRDDGDNVDHIRAALLTYSDVQKYFKRLRKSGYVVRYFAVGEYGSTKGRSHWHVIVFYYSNARVVEQRVQHNADVAAKLKRGKLLPIPDAAVPEHEISTRGSDGDLRDVRFSDAHWQHGHAVWEELLDGYEMSAAKAVRYVCKYLLKDADDDAMQMLGPRLSKKPPLGDAYFRELALRYVKQGLAPQDLFYSFPDVRKRGELKRFMLSAVSADNFCRYYLDAWAAERGGHPPQSDMLDGYLDRMARPSVEAQQMRVREQIWRGERDSRTGALLERKRVPTFVGVRQKYELWAAEERALDVEEAKAQERREAYEFDQRWAWSYRYSLEIEQSEAESFTPASPPCPPKKEDRACD